MSQHSTVVTSEQHFVGRYNVAFLGNINLNPKKVF